MKQRQHLTSFPLRKKKKHKRKIRTELVNCCSNRGNLELETQMPFPDGPNTVQELKLEASSVSKWVDGTAQCAQC